MKNGDKTVFLAANGSEGFVSYFGDCFDAREGWRAYIIKGGAGNGKSTLMRKAAQAAREKGYKPIVCPCSSDPDSLDGVIIEETKTVLLDGTPPHTVEPAFYGVCEQIINLGEFCDCESLSQNREQIISLSDKNSFYHKTASRYLAAYGQLFYDNIKISRQNINGKKLNVYAERLAQSLIPKRKTLYGGKKTHFFLSGITPDGIIGFGDTVTENAEKTVVLEDKYGAAASVILQTVLNTAIFRGYNVYVFKNPFLPSELTDHIYIPELSLGIVCENEHIKFPDLKRRVHTARFYDNAGMKKSRGRLLFNRRIGKSLLLGAQQNLKLARDTHTEIEAYYKEITDFGKINIKTDEILQKIL